MITHLRKGETFAELTAAVRVGTVARLRTIVLGASGTGYAQVVLDGTLFPMDRVAANLVPWADKGHQGASQAKTPTL